MMRAASASNSRRRVPGRAASATAARMVATMRPAWRMRAISRSALSVTMAGVALVYQDKNAALALLLAFLLVAAPSVAAQQTSCGEAFTPIFQIQGSGPTSPLVNQTKTTQG